jgi:hypothetical protein
MTDNKTLPFTGSGDATPIAATKEVTFSGDTTDVQLVEIVGVTGSEGSRTLNEFPNANGLPVVTASTVIDLVLTLDTSAYSNGDVLAAAQELVSAVRATGGTGVIQSIAVIDLDDQAQALDIVISDSTITLGTENAAVSISDADAAKILGIVEVVAGDYVDLANSRLATKDNLGIVVMPDTTSLYISAISRGTGTYTASGIRLRFGILQD